MSRVAWGIVAVLCAQLTALSAFAQSRKSTPPVFALEHRTALVIGSSRYSTAPLRNPGNGARDMAAALRSAGFQVTLRENIGLRSMIEALRNFGDSMRPTVAR